MSRTSNSMCSSKRRFRSQADAIVAASRNLRRKDCNTAALRAYPCPICHGWHLTRQAARR